MKAEMQTGSYTDIGCVRAVNEDDYYVSEYVNDLGIIYAVVADGMGGHNAGEVASSLAIHVACDYIDANFEPERGAEGVKELLARALTYANNSVFSSGSTKSGLKGMGTTFTMLFICGDRAVAAHVGDSRLYRIRGNEIKMLTRDHSLVEELVEIGSITKAQAQEDPRRNVITRAVGAAAEVDADIFELDILKEDTYLLCTDGLTNQLTDEEILNIALKEESPMHSAEKLIMRAKENGGRDNITVVLLKI